MHATHPSQRTFLTLCTLLFIACAAVTVVWCRSMATMEGMDMPGGWTMSMTWMRMPGQTWPGVGVKFIGMWAVMMAAMMLPPLIVVLWRYRHAVSHACALCPEGPPMGVLTGWVAAGYFTVWTASGVLAFPLGATLAALEMASPSLSRIVPVAAGVVMMLAGILQFTTWKSHQLACCRQTPRHDRILPATAGSAWRHGLGMGLHCCACCAPLTAILFVLGVMDLRAMALVTAAITLERFSSPNSWTARVIGLIAIVSGLLRLG
jgi:predicted metal-binding membrane protein